MGEGTGMRKGWRFGALVVAMACALSGCPAPECAKMTRCCAASKDADGVGKWCGEFSTGAKDPDTCRVVTETLRAMYTSREKKPPSACE